MTEQIVTGLCYTCKGWGILSDGSTCPKCEGRGNLTGPPCTKCGGTGDGWTAVTSYKGYLRCPRCNGSGVEPGAAGGQF